MQPSWKSTLPVDAKRRTSGGLCTQLISQPRGRGECSCSLVIESSRWSSCGTQCAFIGGSYRSLARGHGDYRVCYIVLTIFGLLLSGVWTHCQVALLPRAI